MISSLSLTNFKCFRELSLDFGAINVFAGMNGAGKSTVIQSLLAIRQSWDSRTLQDGRLLLNGVLTELGTAGEVYCSDPTSDLIEIALNIGSAELGLKLTCAHQPDRASDYFLTLRAQSIPSVKILSTFSLFTDPFNYLNAERIGARKVFGISPEGEHALRVGNRGENAPYIVASERRELLVENSAVVLESPDGKVYPTIHFQWVLWMARLFPGFASESEIYPMADQVRLGLALQRQQTGQNLFVRPTNTGFGLSYVLGVIVAGLLGRPGTMLVVENPEAHLHPRAQSMLGEFLGRVSIGGTQVMIETHSEHVVNGIRRMVKQQILPAASAKLFFFGRRAHALEPDVTSIAISDTAELSRWPEGFFDQLDKDLDLLLS